MSERAGDKFYGNLGNFQRLLIVDFKLLRASFLKIR